MEPGPLLCVKSEVRDPCKKGKFLRIGVVIGRTTRDDSRVGSPIHPFRPFLTSGFTLEE